VSWGDDTKQNSRHIDSSVVEVLSASELLPRGKGKGKDKRVFV